MAKSQQKAAGNVIEHASKDAESMPCYALSLTVENVRCFGPKQTLDLSNGKGQPAQWTIILGENGTGKTTLLRSLVCFESIRIRLKKENFVTHPIMRLFGHEFFASTDSNDASLGLIRDDAQQASCDLTFIYNSGLDDTSRRQSETAFWTIQRDGSGKGTNSPQNLTVFGYGAGRKLGSAASSSEFADDNAGTLMTDNALLRNAEEWLLQLDYAASKESEIQAQQKKRLEQVKHLLIAILPDVEDIRFITGAGPYPKPRVEFLTFSGWVPLRRLGYGYQTLIAWVTDFASRMLERYPDSSDPLKEPAIVLVDEIDLHLHPLWQRKLIAFLTERFPNTQFIATAHSPLVVQAAENANIAVLKRVGDHVEIMNDPEQIRGWRIDQILTSDLFGLTSARSPEVESLFERKKALLDKARRSKKDEAELLEIQEKIDKLPVGDSAHVTKEMEAIREALALLKDHQSK